MADHRVSVLFKQVLACASRVSVGNRFRPASSFKTSALSFRSSKEISTGLPAAAKAMAFPLSHDGNTSARSVKAAMILFVLASKP